jgi:hypothetical protein
MSNSPKPEAELNKGNNVCQHSDSPVPDSLTDEKSPGPDNIRETSANASQPQHNMEDQLEQMLAPLKSKLQELTQQQENNTASLEGKINEINNLMSELKEELQQQLEDELRPIKELIGLFREWLKNNPEDLSPVTKIGPQTKLQKSTEPTTKLQTSTEPTTTRKGDKEEEDQSLLSEEEQLLKDYKDKEKRINLSKNAIIVSPTIESLDNSRLGVDKLVVLEEKQRKGNYWILTQGSSQYLVPSDTIKINSHNSNTLEELFECEDVNNENKFELLKPAKVSSIGEKKWKLSKPGKLKFIG